MIRYFLAAVVCVTSLAGSASAQSPEVKPLQIQAGQVLTFYLQTRLRAAGESAVDLLPAGTVLKIKMLDAIDSATDRDGLLFHGTVAAPVLSGEAVVIHAEAEVRGVFALLRSRNHPDGFRYELLVTGVKDQDQAFELTASLTPSLFDAGTASTSPSTEKAGDSTPAADSVSPQASGTAQK
jgi:hypothetical protein